MFIVLNTSGQLTFCAPHFKTHSVRIASQPQQTIGPSTSSDYVWLFVLFYTYIDGATSAKTAWWLACRLSMWQRRRQWRWWAQGWGCHQHSGSILGGGGGGGGRLRSGWRERIMTERCGHGILDRRVYGAIEFLLATAIVTTGVVNLSGKRWEEHREERNQRWVHRHWLHCNCVESDWRTWIS